MARLLWATFRDTKTRCGKPWRVFLVDEFSVNTKTEGYPPTVAACAITMAGKREIEIWAGLDRVTREKALGHELFHAMMGKYWVIPKQHEERAATQIEDQFWPTMCSFGARIPPLPSGFAALNRLAKREAWRIMQ